VDKAAPDAPTSTPPRDDGVFRDATERGVSIRARASVSIAPSVASSRASRAAPRAMPGRRARGVDVASRGISSQISRPPRLAAF
jgi:hypothetical protein